MVRQGSESRKNSPDGEIAKVETPILSDELVASIDSFEDALALFGDAGGVTQIGDVAGDGFTLLKDKDILENVPFLLVDWHEVTDPDTLRDYATIRVITSDGRKYRFNDGSTGVFAQLKVIRERTGKVIGILVPKGLFKSDYYVSKDTRKPVGKDFQGEKDKATTWYLNENNS